MTVHNRVDISAEECKYIYVRPGVTDGKETSYVKVLLAFVPSDQESWNAALSRNPCPTQLELENACLKRDFTFGGIE